MAKSKKAAAPAGDNGPAPLTDEDIINFVRSDMEHADKIDVIKAQLKLATNARKSARKTAQAKDISMEEADYAIYLNRMEFQSDAVVKLAFVNRCAVLLGMPDNAEQAEMFSDSLPDIEKDRAHWHSRGYQMALVGSGAFAGKPPSGCPTECYDAWADGVNEAQELIAKSMEMSEAEKTANRAELEKLNQSAGADTDAEFAEVDEDVTA